MIHSGPFRDGLLHGLIAVELQVLINTDLAPLTPAALQNDLLRRDAKPCVGITWHVLLQPFVKAAFRVVLQNGVNLDRPSDRHERS